MSTSEDAFDALEEARADLKRYDNLCFRLSLLIAGGIALALGGAVLAAFVPGVTAIVIGCIVAVVATICLIVRVSVAYERAGYKHPARVVERCEREWNRAMRGE